MLKVSIRQTGDMREVCAGGKAEPLAWYSPRLLTNKTSRCTLKQPRNAHEHRQLQRHWQCSVS